MIDAVKRASAAILEHGGVIRTFENVGVRTLPYTMHRHRGTYSEGHYYLIDFDSSGDSAKNIRESMQRNTDIIRPRILRKELEMARPCEGGSCDFGEMDGEKRK